MNTQQGKSTNLWIYVHVTQFPSRCYSRIRFLHSAAALLNPLVSVHKPPGTASECWVAVHAKEQASMASKKLQRVAENEIMTGYKRLRVQNSWETPDHLKSKYENDENWNVTCLTQIHTNPNSCLSIQSKFPSQSTESQGFSTLHDPELHSWLSRSHCWKVWLDDLMKTTWRIIVESLPHMFGYVWLTPLTAYASAAVLLTFF